jgi:RNA polymerase sigma-54 factor
MLLQRQSPSLRPMTTAHLAQTMTLLELTSDELRQKIEASLASNPALELLETPRCPQCHRILRGSEPCPVCTAPQDPFSDEPIIFVSPQQDFISREPRLGEDGPLTEEWSTPPEDLATFVLRQIAPELAESDRPLAAHILTSLDEDGLLRIPLLEIARYHHVPLEDIQKVQRLIQRAEPWGVGSSSPQQALLAQLEILAEMRPVPELAARAIREGLDLLSRHTYHELGRLLGISGDDAAQLAGFISENLNPYPARAHWGSARLANQANPVYKNPDIIISCLNESDNTPLIVEIVSPYAGSLRINPLFRKALTQVPAEKATQWQSDLDEAVLLVKCLQQRNHTLVRLMQRLAVLQRHYILEGNAQLVPITRARLADELEVHESTISRAVADKAVQLPNKKIEPLSKWFDRSLHIRTVLLQIIAQEVKPLSDTQIADLLVEHGFSVARRTVAKYRAMEGILPARLRQAMRS